MARFASGAGAIVALAFAAGPAAAHEPINGIGPNTLWRGATAVEFQFGGGLMETLRHGGHREDDPTHGREREGMAMLHVAHGLTEDWLAWTGIPLRTVRMESVGPSESAGGLGDIELGLKWRFFREQATAQAWMAAVAAIAHLPTGRTSSEPPVGSGHSVMEFVLTGARDALDLYLWADVRALVPIPGTRAAGPGVGVDLAIGTRFWTPAYRGWDLVPLLEVNFHAEMPETRRGRQVPDTGHATLMVGPGYLLFWDRFETKFAIQVPLWRLARGRQRLADVEAHAGIGVIF